MQMSTIYSIGHGGKKIETFIEELKSFDIEFLIDIRSKPFSKYHPHFSQNELKVSIEKAGIKYVFLGQQLGGLPEDLSCYTDGKVDYEKLKTSDFFISGMERLLSAEIKGIKLAIMCSEADPKECHRTKLIGEVLLDKGISLNHIIDKKRVKNQITVMQELTKGLGLINLFGEETTFTSRKKYN
jgi:uncharacterized protein (DUF488 family)